MADQPLSDDDLLPVAEVARLTGVDVKTVRRWLNSGRLPGQKLGTRTQDRWRVRRGVLTEFLAGGKPLLGAAV